MGIVIYQKSQTEQSSKCKAISRERREKKKIVSLSYINYDRIGNEISSTCSPPTLGAVERVIRAIKQGIEIILDANHNSNSIIDWPTLVKACIFNSNSVERHGGISPFEIMLGRKRVDKFMATFGTEAPIRPE